MGLPDKKISHQPAIRMHSQEVDHIIQARKNLDDITALAQYATQYKSLGWSPVALDADTGTDLGVDFGGPHSGWLNLLMDLTLKKTRVSLAIRLRARFARLRCTRGKSGLWQSLPGQSRRLAVSLYRPGR